MWRVGTAGLYPHHGPPSHAVVVNGASGELVSWDRAEETLRNMRCSRRVLEMCGRCVHGVPAYPRPAAAAHRPEKRRLPTSPTRAKSLVFSGGQRSSDLVGAAAESVQALEPPRPSRAPPPPPPPPKRSGQGIRTAIADASGSAGAPPKPPAPDFHAKKRVAAPAPTSKARGGLGDAKTCQRVSFGSGRVAAALAGHTPDAAAVSREELFPRSHRREAPEVPLKERGGNAVCGGEGSLRGGVVTRDQFVETDGLRAGRRPKPADGPPRRPPVRKRRGDGFEFHSSIAFAAPPPQSARPPPPPAPRKRDYGDGIPPWSPYTKGGQAPAE